MKRAEPPFRPKRLYAGIGGYFGPSYGIKLAGRVLSYEARPDDFAGPSLLLPEIEPTDEQWRAFRRALDKINVWQWQALYPNPGVLDGTQWTFEVTYSDHVLKTHGDNNYPDAQGAPINSPDGTKTFESLMRAIRKLTGRPFR